MAARGVLVLTLFVLLIIFVTDITASITDVPPQEFSSHFNRDAALLKIYVHSLDKTMAVIEGEKSLFNRERTEDFTIAEKDLLYALWAHYLDYVVAIESLTEKYKKFYLLPDKERSNKSFLMTYASYLAKISYGLKFISRTINNELYEKKLDDANLEYGIPEGMYAKLKWNTIHVQDVSNVLAGYAYLDFLMEYYEEIGLMDDGKTAWIFDHVRSHFAYTYDELKLKGVEYFTANGVDILKDSSFKAWFPVQMNVARVMGDVKVKRPHEYLIEQGQILQMGTLLKPGDIIVTRKNWYLSNIGLPGFWPHAGLYLGPYPKFMEFFEERSVTDYYISLGNYTDFPDYLMKKYPDRVKKFMSDAPDGHPHEIMEAVSEGVKFSSLLEGASADYLGVMRPRLSKLDIAKAIDEAFSHVGKPYDFNFDFLTDSTLVCSELVYKAYLNGREKKGLDLPLREVAGRKVVPPNDIVRKFDVEFGTQGQELDFVYFLDGSEKKKRSFAKGIMDFRASHKRLKWDIVQH